jgi:hypothetical protein
MLHICNKAVRFYVPDSSKSNCIALYHFALLQTVNQAQRLFPATLITVINCAILGNIIGVSPESMLGKSAGRQAFQIPDLEI